MKHTSANSSLFQVNISDTIGSEYIAMFNTLTQYIVIQLMIQIMLHITFPNCYSVFDADYVTLILFMIVGILFYFLVIKKIICFA
jgi:hypothetical protein